MARRSLTLSAGRHDLRGRLGAGDQLVLRPPGPFRLRGLVGGPGELLQVVGLGTITRGDEGVSFFDGCRYLECVELKASGCGHGLRWRGCTDLVVRQCQAQKNLIEGFIWGGCHRVVVEDCAAWDNGVAVGHYGHGLYFGYRGTEATFRRVSSRNNRGFGLHLNGTSDEGSQMRAIRVEDSAFVENGTGGTGNVDCAYCEDLTMVNCLLAMGRGGLKLTGDGQRSPRFGVRQATLSRCTVVTGPGANHTLWLEAGSQLFLDACLLVHGTAHPVTRRDGARAVGRGGTVVRPWSEAREVIGPGHLSRLPEVGWRPNDVGS